MTRYPGISDRIKALVFDGVVIGILMFIASGLISNQEQEVSDTTRILSFVGIFFLYEPLFVAFLGGTIGHKANRLKVKSFNNPEKNVNIAAAIFRSAIKYLLGIISLLVMGTNNENRALHDTMAGSVVLFSDRPDLNPKVEEEITKHHDDEVIDAGGD